MEMVTEGSRHVVGSGKRRYPTWSVLMNPPPFLVRRVPGKTELTRVARNVLRGASVCAGTPARLVGYANDGPCVGTHSRAGYVSSGTSWTMLGSHNSLPIYYCKSQKA